MEKYEITKEELKWLIRSLILADNFAEAIDLAERFDIPPVEFARLANSCRGFAIIETDED